MTMSFETLASYDGQWKVTGINRGGCPNQVWKDGKFMLQNNGRSWRCALSIRSSPNREPYHYTLSSKIKAVHFKNRMLLELTDGVTIHVRDLNRKDQADLEAKMATIRTESSTKTEYSFGRPTYRFTSPSKCFTSTFKRSPFGNQGTNSAARNFESPREKIQAESPTLFTGVKDSRLSRKERMMADAKENGHEDEENISHSTTPKNKFLVNGQKKSEDALHGVSAGNFYGNSAAKSYSSFASLSKRSPGLLPMYPEKQHEKRREKLTELHHNKSPTYSWGSRTPQSPSVGHSSSLQGFSNLGNTCYMNAILQSLFSLESFSSDLLYSITDTSKRTTIEQRKTQLSWMLSRLICAKRKESGSWEAKKSILAQVKRSISSSAKRFSGYEQHDAHEFLGQVLDQLREEVTKINKKSSEDSPAALEDAQPEGTSPSVTTLQPGGSSPDSGAADDHPNPARDNFEFKVAHQIICKGCGERVETIETFHDLSIDMPARQVLGSVRSIQDALDHFFLPEQLEYTCEHCGGKQASVQHKFVRLPRVLILHLKRYAYNSVTSSNTKLGQNIHVPKYLTLRKQCEEQTQPALPAQEPYSFGKDDQNVCSVTPFNSSSKLTSATPTPELATSVTSNRSPEGRRTSVSSRRKLDLGEEGEVDGEPIQKMSEDESLNLVLELSKESASKEKSTRERLDSLTVESMTEEQQIKMAMERSVHETTLMDTLNDENADTEPMDTAENQPQSDSKASNPCPDTKASNPCPTSLLEPPFKRARFEGQSDSAYSSFTEDSLEDKKQEAAQKTEQPDVIELSDGTEGGEQNGDEVTSMTLDLSDEENKENYTPGLQGSASKLNSSMTDSSTKPTLGKGEDIDEEEQLRLAIANSLKDQHHLEVNQDDELEKAKELSLQSTHKQTTTTPQQPSWNLTRSKEEEILLAKHAEDGDLPYSYQLSSIVSHLGSSSNVGHYISDVYDVRKRVWLSWDDSHMSRLPEDEVRKSREKTGYIFFYVCKEVVQELEDHYYQQRALGRSTTLTPAATLTSNNTMTQQKAPHMVITPGSATKSPVVNMFGGMSTSGR